MKNEGYEDEGKSLKINWNRTNLHIDSGHFSRNFFQFLFLNKHQKQDREEIQKKKKKI